MYSITFEEVAVTVAQDLFEITVSDTSNFTIIHSISISQSSDAGDSASEMLKILCYRTPNSSGSGGSAVTASPMEVGDSAYSSGSVLRNNTTQASILGSQLLYSDTFNILEGFYKQFAPNERLIIPTANDLASNFRFILALNTAPADSLTMSCTIVLEEL